MADDLRRILLLGGSGQVGHELRRALGPLWNVTAPNRTEANLAAPDTLRALVRRYRPDVIVNAAAYTAVDRAEEESALAHRVNEEAPGILAEEATTIGASLVHFSTDYVFDGKKIGPYSETDLPRPLSVYGTSKLAGEGAVARGAARHLILRTSWVFGAHGTNFLKTMLRLGAAHEELRVIADQIGAPTSAALLAQATSRAIAALANGSSADERWGLYHVTASGSASWHGYARLVVERARLMGMSLTATPESVLPISTAEYPAAAPRPANSLLDTRKFRTTFALDLPDWKHGVEAVLRSLIAQPAR